MAVAGPSHFIDLSLDSEDDFFDHSKSAACSDPYEDSVIVLDDDVEIQISKRFRVNGQKSTSTHTRAQKVVDLSDDEVLILNSLPIASSSKIPPVARGKADYLAEDEELARRLAQEYDEIVPINDNCTDSLAADEELARRLAQQYDADLPNQRETVILSEDETLARFLAQEYNEGRSIGTTSSDEDERLAVQLAQEEEKSYKELLETIENNKDGIVFSVVVNAADNTLEDGSPAHPDDLERFRPWKQLCEKSGCPKVTKFHWFVNYELEKRFELACDKLESIMGERPQEIQLFHGTAAANVESILKGGFRIGGVDGHPVVNGTAMGHGIYLAAAAATSLGYAAGSNKIFACRVVPGRMTNRPIHKPPRSVHIGSESFECYSGGGVYVHRFASLVLPCYMIEFDVPVQPILNNFGVAALRGGFAGAFKGMMGGMIPGMGLPGAGMPLPAIFPPPLVASLPLPAVAPKPRRRAPPRIKAPTEEAAPTPRKRTRALPEGEGASVTPRKRQRRTQHVGDNEDDAVAPPSSRKGKGKAKEVVQRR